MEPSRSYSLVEEINSIIISLSDEKISKQTITSAVEKIMAYIISHFSSTNANIGNSLKTLEDRLKQSKFESLTIRVYHATTEFIFKKNIQHLDEYLKQWAEQSNHIERRDEAQNTIMTYFKNKIEILLDLKNLNLTELPNIFNLFFMSNRLPTELNLSRNRLTSLPMEIFQIDRLRNLNLSHNSALTGIPMEILNLNPRCIVDLSGTSLSQGVLNNLRTATEVPGYQGPRISYSMFDVNPRGIETKSIEDSLKGLYEIAKKPYVPFLPGNGIDENELKSWLSRLSYMADYKASPKRREWLVSKVLDYLTLADKNPKFRESFGITIVGAAETCGDRVALSILKVGINYRLATIDTSNLKELAEFHVRGVWATNLLENIAREKILILPFFDEIEVYLGYQVMLKTRLQLPIDIEEMLYFTCSALTEKDLEQATLFVSEKLENESARLEFLINEKKWLKALSEKYPIEYQGLDKEKEASSEKAETQEESNQVQEKFRQGLIELTKCALTE
jgi:C-terminal novel E3 ligase, LRR-interacting